MRNGTGIGINAHNLNGSIFTNNTGVEYIHTVSDACKVDD